MVPCQNLLFRVMLLLPAALCLSAPWLSTGHGGISLAFSHTLLFTVLADFPVSNSVCLGSRNTACGSEGRRVTAGKPRMQWAGQRIPSAGVPGSTSGAPRWQEMSPQHYSALSVISALNFFQTLEITAGHY